MQIQARSLLKGFAIGGVISTCSLFAFHACTLEGHVQSTPASAASPAEPLVSSAPAAPIAGATHGGIVAKDTRFLIPIPTPAPAEGMCSTSSGNLAMRDVETAAVGEIKAFDPKTAKPGEHDVSAECRADAKANGSNKVTICLSPAAREIMRREIPRCAAGSP